MSEPTYEIALASRCVTVEEFGVYGQMSFQSLEDSTSQQIKDGEHVRMRDGYILQWENIAPQRRIAYAIARDELIDLGLVEDIAL